MRAQEQLRSVTSCLKAEAVTCIYLLTLCALFQTNLHVRLLRLQMSILHNMHNGGVRHIFSLYSDNHSIQSFTIG